MNVYLIRKGGIEVLIKLCLTLVIVCLCSFAVTIIMLDNGRRNIAKGALYVLLAATSAEIVCIFIAIWR